MSEMRSLFIVDRQPIGIDFVLFVVVVVGMKNTTKCSSGESIFAIYYVKIIRVLNVYKECVQNDECNGIQQLTHGIAHTTTHSPT